MRHNEFMLTAHRVESVIARLESPNPRFRDEPTRFYAPESAGRTAFRESFELAVVDGKLVAVPNRPPLTLTESAVPKL